MFTEQALTVFSDGLLYDGLDEIRAGRFLAKPCAEKIEETVDETKDDEGKYLRLEYIAGQHLVRLFAPTT